MIIYTGIDTVEEILISPVILTISIYRLPHGQYGYSGHIINLPQDVSGFVHSLPCELAIILVKNPDIFQSHHDFRVRKSVVLRALHFLINNSIYFSNITINSDKLSVLPDDDTISNTHMCAVQSNSSLNDSDQSEDNDDPHHLATTFIPGKIFVYHYNSLLL